MYCANCGKQVEDNQVFCPNCGERLGEEQIEVLQQKAKTKEKEKKKGGCLGQAIALIALILIAFLWLFPTDSFESANVEMVKNGTSANYPNQTYGDAFDNFFGNPSWSAFETDDGTEIVDFTGECYYADQEVTAYIQFTLDKENGTFEATYLSFNDVAQNQLIMNLFLSAVFENSDTYESTHSNSAVKTSSPFMNEGLKSMALDYYEKETGYRPEYADAVDNGDGTITIQLYDQIEDHIATSAWYTIDYMSAEGTDDRTGEYINLNDAYQ